MIGRSRTNLFSKSRHILHRYRRGRSSRARCCSSTSPIFSAIVCTAISASDLAPFMPWPPRPLRGCRPVRRDQSRPFWYVSGGRCATTSLKTCPFWSYMGDGSCRNTKQG